MEERKDVRDVVVHKSVIKEWSERKKTPEGLSKEQIEGVLDYIESSSDSIIFEGSVESEDDLRALVKQVGKGNTVRLMGARAGVCLNEVSEVLEKSGVNVEWDSKGILP